ncbi:MAG: flagellar basal body rod protein FlgB [Eubacteriales bacterium]|nr:flagellar basal body rod protein FlgB [Eubacteriales bacterium]
MLERLTQNTSILEKGLDAVWTKNEVLAANIANADTPGYKSKTVDFESVFSQVLQVDGFFAAAGTDRSSGPALSRTIDLDALKATITENQALSQKLDGNTVDLDREMTDLAENSILYDTLTYAVSKELGRLKMILNEGK